MHDIMPYLALLVVILTGVGIVKKLQVNILLLFAGIALNLIAILGGVTDLMPKGAHSTGFIGFDLFGLLSALSRPPGGDYRFHHSRRGRLRGLYGSDRGDG